MQQYPLLDLADNWKEVHSFLDYLQALATTLWVESQYTWLDMLIVRQRIMNARQALGLLPPDILAGIANDEADLAEIEAHADASA
jgi:hypothetical protein